MERRGEQKTSTNIDERRVMMTVFMPLSEIVLDFHDQLKSISSGYASFDYEPQGYHSSNIVKMEVFVNGQSVEELSRIIHASKATPYARDLVHQLREKIPRQMIQIAIQACVNGKVLARETLKAYRKDVTAKLVSTYDSIQFIVDYVVILKKKKNFKYGGDVTRRTKLLKQQAEGKKRMRSLASVKVPHDTFISLLRR